MGAAESSKVLAPKKCLMINDGRMLIDLDRILANVHGPTEVEWAINMHESFSLCDCKSPIRVSAGGLEKTKEGFRLTLNAKKFRWPTSALALWASPTQDHMGSGGRLERRRVAGPQFRVALDDYVSLPSTEGVVSFADSPLMKRDSPVAAAVVAAGGPPTVDFSLVERMALLFDAHPGDMHHLVLEQSFHNVAVSRQPGPIYTDFTLRYNS